MLGRTGIINILRDFGIGALTLIGIIHRNHKIQNIIESQRYCVLVLVRVNVNI